MDVLARKMALIQWLIDLQDMKILNQIESLSNSKAEMDTKSALTAGLDHALMQVEQGQVLSGDEVRARVRKKYNL